MDKKGTTFLKFIFTFIVMISSFLYVFVIPNNENSFSMLNTHEKYNTVPYLEKKEEIALVDEKEIKSKVLDTYTGTITAYGPDCDGCSGTTASGYTVVRNNKIITTYNDTTYGNVRILAADQIGFPFGTIVKITGPRIDNYILGIVLDTGGAMRNEWAKGNVLMDLLFESEKGKDVYDFGRQKNVTFEILRYGK